MKWDKLKVFYQVAKLNSVTQAAHYMGLNQSSVSRIIQQIEKSYKKPLFLRLHKTLRLTKEGEIVFNIVQRIIADVDSIPQMLDEDFTLPRGNLRLATTNAMASMWLPFYVPAFLEKYPDMTLTILANDEELDLTINEADVAIRPHIPHQPEYIQRYLMTFNLAIYASPEYLEKHGTPQKPEDLDHHHLLVFGDDTVHPYGNINWLLRLGRRTNEPREPYIRINSGHGLQKMAEAGLGVVALSKEHPALTTANLVNVLPDITGPSVDIYYVYPRTLSHFRRITAFADHLEDVLESKKHNLP